MIIRPARAVLLLLLWSLVPTTVHASQICVWGSAEGTAVSEQIQGWQQQAGLAQTPLAHSLNISKNELVLRLYSGNDAVEVKSVLSPDCSRTTRLVVTSGQPQWIAERSAGELIERLGLSSVIVEGGHPSEKTAGTDSARKAATSALQKYFDVSNPFDIALAVIALIFIVTAFSVPSSKTSSRIVDAIFGLAVMFLAARPIFNIPFSADCQILRVGFSAANVFGDWNHPFLPYLLNRPAVLLTYNPVVLRIIPFIWVLAEAGLFAEAARRLAGRAAAALVIVWMAVSLRQTMGMIDLSDWNLAGIFLAAMLLWIIQYVERTRLTRWLPVPALLILGGCFSSYMMIVPSAVLTVYLGHERLRRRISTYQAGAACVALLVSTFFVAQAFIFGRNITIPHDSISVTELLKNIVLVEPPLGLGPIMPFLAAGGLLIGLSGPKRAVWGFGVVSILASVVGLVLALLGSSINGAYYFGLMKGVVFVAAAVFAADVTGLLASGFAGSRQLRRIPSFVIPAICGLILMTLTVNIKSRLSMSETGGLNRLPEFVELMRREKTLVYTNFSDSLALAQYQEVLNGRLDISAVIDKDASNWILNSFVDVRGNDWGINNDCAGVTPYKILAMLYRESDPKMALPCCPTFHEMQCVEILVNAGHPPCADSDRLFCYFECVQKPTPDL